MVDKQQLRITGKGGSTRLWSPEDLPSITRHWTLRRPDLLLRSGADFLYLKDAIAGTTTTDLYNKQNTTSNVRPYTGGFAPIYYGPTLKGKVSGVLTDIEIPHFGNARFAVANHGLGLTTVTQFSVFGVIYDVATNGGAVPLTLDGENYAAGRVCAAEIPNGTTDWNAYSGTLTAINKATITPKTIVAPQATVFSWIKTPSDGSDKKTYLRLNGGAYSGQSSGTGTAATVTAQLQYGWGTSTPGSLVWSCPELIICSTAVEDSVRDQVEGYLGQNWALHGSTNLIATAFPASHPYKISLPTTVVGEDGDPMEGSYLMDSLGAFITDDLSARIWTG